MIQYRYFINRYQQYFHPYFDPLIRTARALFEKRFEQLNVVNTERFASKWIVSRIHIITMPRGESIDSWICGSKL